MMKKNNHLIIIRWRDVYRCLRFEFWQFKPHWRSVYVDVSVWSSDIDPTGINLKYDMAIFSPSCLFSLSAVPRTWNINNMLPWISLGNFCSSSTCDIWERCRYCLPPSSTQTVRDPYFSKLYFSSVGHEIAKVGYWEFLSWGNIDWWSMRWRSE